MALVIFNDPTPSPHFFFDNHKDSLLAKPLRKYLLKIKLCLILKIPQIAHTLSICMTFKRFQKINLRSIACNFNGSKACPGIPPATDSM